MVGGHGLSGQLQQVFSQKGAKVQVSSKPSEETIKERNLWISYDSKGHNRSIFDDSFIIRPSNWVITVARHKLGARAQHTFMIMESIEEMGPGKSYYRIRRFDFYLELRHCYLAILALYFSTFSMADLNSNEIMFYSVFTTIWHGR